jgi:hypothetical protein
MLAVVAEDLEVVVQQMVVLAVVVLVVFPLLNLGQVELVIQAVAVVECMVILAVLHQAQVAQVL